MTIAAQIPVATPRRDDDVAWRALRDGLWAARRDGRHLGTVEKGRRWLALDADGDPIGAFRFFAEAQAAVTEPTRGLPGRAGTAVRAGSPMLPSLAMAGTGALLVAFVTSWAVQSFLL
jgi:hypothetical protein